MFYEDIQNSFDFEIFVDFSANPPDCTESSTKIVQFERKYVLNQHEHYKKCLRKTSRIVQKYTKIYKNLFKGYQLLRK